MQLSPCDFCKHLTGLEDMHPGMKARCPAFPDGVPQEIYIGDDKHKSVDPRQIGKLTFEPDDDEETKYILSVTPI